MKRKHWKLIAAAFQATEPSTVFVGGYEKHRQWERDVNEVAIALQSDNPNFDRVRFIKACGGKEE